MPDMTQNSQMLMDSLGSSLNQANFNDLELLPFPGAKTAPEDCRPDAPVHGHCRCNSNYAIAKPDAENPEKKQSDQQSAGNRNDHGKLHIPRCPQSQRQSPGKRKKRRIEYIVNSHQENDQPDGLGKADTALESGASEPEPARSRRSNTAK